MILNRSCRHISLLVMGGSLVGGVLAATLMTGGSPSSKTYAANPPTPALPSRPAPSASPRGVQPGPSASAATDPLLPSLPEGAVLHTVVEQYERIGPALALVRADAGWRVEERTTIESWQRVGTGGTLAQARTLIRDASGALLSTHDFDGETVMIRLPDGSIAQQKRPDGVHPAQLRLGRHLTVPAPGAAAAARFAQVSSHLGARIAEAAATDGRKVKTAEESSPYRQQSLWPNGYSLPFVEDLHPQQMEYRLTFTDAADRLISSQDFAVDSAGEKQLVHEDRILLEEVIPADAVPPGIF